jgi:uncharacterized protein YbaP (TraB family)
MRLADWGWRIVQALTLLHAFLFVLFLATLANAAGAATPACGGADLLEQLQKESPEKWEKVRAEAAATANGEGILWKVSAPGAAPSYLFGTMHSPDRRIARLNDAAAEAFAESRLVLVENVESLDPKAMPKAVLALRHLTLLRVGVTLESMVGAEHTDLLRRKSEDHGIAWSVARILQPWIVAAAIASPVCDATARQQGAPVLDQLIAERARREGKALQGLETIEEQFTAMAGLPREFHVNGLVDLLALGPLADDLSETTKRLYLAGQTGALLPLARAFSPRSYAGAGVSQFRTRLISERNQRMAERALPHLSEGGVFLAVGALHLPGDDGLVELLRRRGLTVERAGLPERS